MFKHFRESIIVTILGFIAAWFWAAHIEAGTELKTLFIVFFLSILEVTLSFDNAVVNAVVLDKMTPKWQHRFLTWGIIIAVFGVRFLLPVIIVSIFSRLSIIKTVHMALEDVTQYTHYLHLAHAPLVAFGGSFLLMVGLSYFVGKNNHHKWLPFIENLLEKINFRFSNAIITSLVIFILQFFLPDDIKWSVITSAVTGVVSYEVIHGLCGFMEKKQEASIASGAAKGGLMMFIYLETIDASFSLDGVLGSFAISKDIVVIAIGLAIGAMFVRSLTLLFVERKTLNQYIYLVSGAHFAIISLAIIMFISVFKEVNEIITGSIGLLLVGGSFISSLIENKKNPDKYVKRIE
ncbi:TPA: DUF475 domain-containing protein [Candidatus Galligastranaerophilus gallistercoris]|nr:DUF475 domain-containing protein [Candidatus Galligastranaerophilus gallistercoris]